MKHVLMFQFLLLLVYGFQDGSWMPFQRYDFKMDFLPFNKTFTNVRYFLFFLNKMLNNILFVLFCSFNTSIQRHLFTFENNFFISLFNKTLTNVSFLFFRFSLYSISFNF